MALRAVEHSFGKHRRGDTFDEKTFRLLINGAPQSLAGMAIDSKFRYKTSVGEVTRDLSIGNGITIVDEANGVFKYDAFVSDLRIGKHLFDTQFTYPTGRIKTYMYGSIISTEEYTYG